MRMEPGVGVPIPPTSTRMFGCANRHSTPATVASLDDASGATSSTFDANAIGALDAGEPSLAAASPELARAPSAAANIVKNVLLVIATPRESLGRFGHPRPADPIYPISLMQHAELSELYGCR